MEQSGQSTTVDTWTSFGMLRKAFSNLVPRACAGMRVRHPRVWVRDWAFSSVSTHCACSFLRGETQRIGLGLKPKGSRYLCEHDELGKTVHQLKSHSSSQRWLKNFISRFPAWPTCPTKQRSIWNMLHLPSLSFHHYKIWNGVQNSVMAEGVESYRSHTNSNWCDTHCISC